MSAKHAALCMVQLVAKTEMYSECGDLGYLFSGSWFIPVFSMTDC